jgi:hypothetical protein
MTGSVPHLRRVLRRAGAHARSFYRCWRMPHGGPIEQALDVAFTSADGFIRPVQSRREMEGLLRWLARRRPSTVVEIGTASGGSLLLLARAAADEALIVSIDLPGGEFGGGNRPWRIPLYKSFARKRQRLHLIRADSHLPATVARLKKILSGRAIDFLFIDGDHRYEGVKTDFELYRPLMKLGGRWLSTTSSPIRLKCLAASIASGRRSSPNSAEPNSSRRRIVCHPFSGSD